jgi:asparagine synthase (glutamine-hydrolysing)
VRRVVSIATGTLDADRGATVYAGIRRLLPCEVLSASPRGLRTERYLPRIGRRYRRGRVEDFAVELRDHLDAAVARAIGASRNVAVLASGGLDSSGLLALAAARLRGESPQALRAISLQSKGPGDDRPYFAQLVKALGVSPVHLFASDAGKWFRQSLCADGQPCAGLSTCLDLLFYATAANLGVDVTLCGSAGDSICGGPLPFAQLARRGHVLAALNAALRVRVPWSITPWARVRSLLVRPFVPSALLRARRRWLDHSPWMTRRSRELVDGCRDDVPEWPPRSLPDTPDEWMEEWCEGEDCVLPDVADIGGQALAVTGAAVFDAFMDFDFVRFMFEIDPVLLSHGHEYRGLYRLAMKGVLPEPIRTRQDKASFEPAIAAAALAANALEMLSDLSSLEAFAGTGLVDPGPFRPMFERWLGAVRLGERAEEAPGDECGQQVWQLLSVEAFLRSHGVGRDLA